MYLEIQSFCWKLIANKNLFLELFCSSQTVHIWRSVLAHPAICTGTSGDLYWRIRRSVLAHPVVYEGQSISTHRDALSMAEVALSNAGVPAASAMVVVGKQDQQDLVLAPLG